MTYLDSGSYNDASFLPKCILYNDWCTSYVGIRWLPDAKLIMHLKKNIKVCLTSY